MICTTATAQLLAFFGLGFTLVCAALLFFYGLPKKTLGNVVVYGDMMITADAKPGETELSPEVWQPQATAFLRRAALLNRTGFALIAIGTVMQMVAGWPDAWSLCVR